MISVFRFLLTQPHTALKIGDLRLGDEVHIMEMKTRLNIVINHCNGGNGS